MFNSCKYKFLAYYIHALNIYIVIQFVKFSTQINPLGKGDSHFQINQSYQFFFSFFGQKEIGLKISIQIYLLICPYGNYSFLIHR